MKKKKSFKQFQKDLQKATTEERQALCNCDPLTLKYPY